MGIERFFKSINSLYSNKFIKPIYKNDSITHLYFDFNSIIHKVSNNIINHLNDLLLYSLIYKYSDKSGMNKDIVLEEFNKINKIYNFNYTVENFYQNTKKISINNLIYYHIFNDIRHYLSFYPKCNFLYIGIDGVPSVGKMIEQQDRRYKGYLMSMINKQLLLKYKSQLDNNEFNDTNIYNEYEYLTMKFSFDKNLISPQTDFMLDFINQLKKESFKENLKVIISDFNERGEGEKKIVIHIKKYSLKDDNIVIYSPDADMIIMTMILKFNIFILRHEQTTSEDAIIDIEAIKKEFSPVNDIAYIFSVFGDDFIPKIDWINVTKHISKILEEYKKMDLRIIDDKSKKVNLLNLQKFFKQIKKLEYIHKLSKNRFDDLLKPVNYKSFKYYNEVNDINNLSRNYEPIFDTKENTIPGLDYYKAMLWKYNYYFLDDESNNDYYYPNHGAPTIDILINFNEFNKVNLDAYKTTNIMPIDQLCFISPINVSIYVKKQKLNNELADNLFKLMKINLPIIKIGEKNNININEIFNCRNARYLNKCYVKFDLIKFNDFKKLINLEVKREISREVKGREVNSEKMVNSEEMVNSGEVKISKKILYDNIEYEYVIDTIHSFTSEYLDEIDTFFSNQCFDINGLTLKELKTKYKNIDIDIFIILNKESIIFACLLAPNNNNIYISSICVGKENRLKGILKNAMIFLAKNYKLNQNNIFNIHADKRSNHGLDQKKRIKIYSKIGFFIENDTIIELDSNKKAKIDKNIIENNDIRYYVLDEDDKRYIVDSSQIDKCLTKNLNYVGYKIGDRSNIFNNLIIYSCPMVTTPDLILKFNK